MRRGFRDHRLLSPAVLIVVVIVLGIWMPSNFGYRIATLVWISAIASIGLNLLMGCAGQVSLGHAGFFGIGAYAVAVLPTRLSLNSWLSVIAGAVASGVVAYIVGTPILRLKGYYLAIATLGLGILIAMVINNEGWLTGGPDGIQVPRPFVFGWRLRGLEVWYWITGGVTVVGAWLAANVLASSTGRAMRALQDSETAAQIAGVNVARVKLVAFVLSAGISTRLQVREGAAENERPRNLDSVGSSGQPAFVVDDHRDQDTETQCRDRKVIAFEAKNWGADDIGYDARRYGAGNHRQPGIKRQSRRQHGYRISADSEKTGVPETDLAGASHQQIEPD